MRRLQPDLVVADVQLAQVVKQMYRLSLEGSLVLHANCILSDPIAQCLWVSWTVDLCLCPSTCTSYLYSITSPLVRLFFLFPDPTVTFARELLSPVVSVLVRMTFPNPMFYFLRHQDCQHPLVPTLVLHATSQHPRTSELRYASSRAPPDMASVRFSNARSW